MYRSSTDCPMMSGRSCGMRGYIFLVLGMLLFLGSFQNGLVAQTQTSRSVGIMTIDGAIGPATSDYIQHNFAKAVKQNLDMVILRLDTPGGLDKAMRDIIQDILASPIPVICYVAPSGARAASAGTYILYGCHIAAMAPGTNLGAATPVQIGVPNLPGKAEKPENEEKDKETRETPNPNDAMARKLVNDATAYLRTLAQMRGRNVDWAERAVREGASLPAQEALEQGVIDLIAADMDSLLLALDGREIKMTKSVVTLKTSNLTRVPMEPDWRNKFLGVITNPNVAYLLLIIGFYGLVLEFYNPGAILPGVVGTISLLLALYALQMLPVDYVGLALILLGIALMISEALVPSFGVLGLGGTVALVFGSIFLIDTEQTSFGISWQLIAAIAVSNVFIFTFVVAMVLKSRQRPVVSGTDALLGCHGEVISWSGKTGEILIMGERWQGQSQYDLSAGEFIRVIEVDSLTLKVEPENEGD